MSQSGDRKVILCPSALNGRGICNIPQCKLAHGYERGVEFAAWTAGRLCPTDSGKDGICEAGSNCRKHILLI